jgi:hypothetical protein
MTVWQQLLHTTTEVPKNLAAKKGNPTQQHHAACCISHMHAASKATELCSYDMGSDEQPSALPTHYLKPKSDVCHCK